MEKLENTVEVTLKNWNSGHTATDVYTEAPWITQQAGSWRTLAWKKLVQSSYTKGIIPQDVNKELHLLSLEPASH